MEKKNLLFFSTQNGRQKLLIITILLLSVEKQEMSDVKKWWHEHENAIEIENERYNKLINNSRVHVFYLNE